MQNYNEPARVERNSDFGHVWMEVISGAAVPSPGIEVARFTAVRVRATAAVTVRFDGVLAATMTAGEILIFNSGRGNVLPPASKKTVTLITTGTAFIQVAAMTQNDIENQIP